ncbi:MAG: precorrin-8X methylmutase [Cyanobacteria bacterium J06623_7]
MDLNFTEVSSLAIIDRQIAGIQATISPAQYEIVRRVVYRTADLEYQSLVRFSEGALAKGAAALTAAIPIIVDVPEVQVSIVPQLQKTFANPVYCCTTTPNDTETSPNKAVGGLKVLASKHPNAIFIIGQDQAAMIAMVELLNSREIEPSLAIATPPLFVSATAKQQLRDSLIPSIYLDSAKGGSVVANAIFNSLIDLVWQAEKKHR